MRKERLINNVIINYKLKSISIATKEVVYNDDDSVFAMGDLNRMGFIPGQLDAVKQYADLADDDDLIIYLNSLWTDEAIQAYRDHMEQNEL